MFEKLKKFFKTKYRIIQVYNDYEQAGFIVQKKAPFGRWHTAQMQKIERMKYENDVLTEHDAFFLTKDEAIGFISMNKTTI